MGCRGVRGATTVEENNPESILSRTKELLSWMVISNGIEEEDVAAAFFTATPDLNAAFPAAAARAVGWTTVPLLGAQELDVQNAPPKSIRILILWETDKSQEEIRHVYLHGAAGLRPDVQLPEVEQNEIEKWIENRTNGGK